MTVILTTHDLQDVEHLARRIILIDKGRIGFDGRIGDLRSRLGNHKRIRLRSPDFPEDFSLAGVRMIAKFRPLALALAAAFGIFACNAERPSDPASEGTGSARVKLPTVPQGYVPDSALDSAGHSVFLLAVTGPDMSPILKSWELRPGSVEKAVITGIPVGWPRVFTGTLVWVTAWGDTLNTHEGRDSVAITMDSIAQVSLFLRKIGSSGSAEVCVEVEGWDADPDCVKPPGAIDINGCWKISVA